MARRSHTSPRARASRRAPRQVAALGVPRRPPASVLEASDRLPFGGRFFLDHLAGFVTQRCQPDSTRLPRVELHLLEGDVVDVCHVVGVSRRWVAVAVSEGVGQVQQPRLRLELVPYYSIRRVTVRTSRSTAAHIGFDSDHEPEVLTLEGELTPEAALAALAARPRRMRRRR